MKLDTSALRYLTSEDWRVLTAVEQGSRNHEIVPTPLINQLSGLRGGSSIHKSISTLAKANLIARKQGAKYDGYRLTYGGLDYLALHTFSKRASIYSVGTRVGVGKESDIFTVASSNSPQGKQHILKIHRLGRISFRSVKSNRDYLSTAHKRRAHQSGSAGLSGGWMHMSRLAALKEWTFLKVLRENGFPVPEPLDQSRHAIVMELVDAPPLRQVKECPNPAGLYAELVELVLRLARFGLIHGDFNEFNVLAKEEEEEEEVEEKEGNVKEKNTDNKGALSAGDDEVVQKRIRVIPILIDFPQVVSIDHPNAEMYFDRDVQCIKRFFQRRFGFTSDNPGPFFADAKAEVGKDGAKRLDVEAEASGFSKKMAKELEKYMKEVSVDGDGAGNDDGAHNGNDDDEIDEDEDDDDDPESESKDQRAEAIDSDEQVQKVTEAVGGMVTNTQSNHPVALVSNG
ncbi:hypothetical protein MMC25_007032 [Agyrium rufum]|nr:hypothetical protein [Agyrium rufum]